MKNADTRLKISHLTLKSLINWQILFLKIPQKTTSFEHVSASADYCDWRKAKTLAPRMTTTLRVKL